ncbi:hypothetical protein [Natrinema versiforme]|uniref:NADH dehydrogenase-like complex subunit J2 n=1 Tax=Natrinema versiforme JCM 10478 TaxID=1227496 RepID=L9Y986_9EURY|nr:hypothetical protein [Natrinema versiforme]ELY70267.1 hypothetical protein C489_02936 [Natrinema versiforme JCM 10478]
MTTGPKLRLGKTLVPGLLAVGLFAVMALITLNASFEPMTAAAGAGFPDDISITAELGYALFGFDSLQQIGGTEPFLAAVLLVAIALDAALDASLVLAKREEGGEPVAALSSTGDSSSSSEGAAPAVADGGSAETADQSADAGGENR